MFPNAILNRLDEFDEDKRQEIILYESLRGVSMSNFDEAFQYISKALSHKPVLISIVRKFAENCEKVPNKKALKKVFETLDIPHTLRPSKEFILNDDVGEFAEWNWFNEVDYDILKELVKWDCVKILKSLISQGTSLDKVKMTILKNGNYEIIHLLEQQYDLKSLKYCPKIFHYDVIEWLKTRYGINVKPFSNSLLYHPRKIDLKLAIKYDLSVCYGSFNPQKTISWEVYWNAHKELIIRGLVNILSHVKSFTTYDLYIAIEMMNEEAFKIIIEKIPKIEPITATKSSLLKTVVNTSNMMFVRSVSEKLKERLKDDFKNELLRIDSKRNTLLHIASKQSSKEVFNYVCKMIERECSERTLLNMFSAKDSLGKTPTDYLEALHDKPCENIPTEVSIVHKGRYGKLNIKRVI